MVLRWHILAHAAAATLTVSGCFLFHEGPEPAPAPATDDAGASFADAETAPVLCGHATCAYGQVCRISCGGERECIPSPPVRKACEGSCTCYERDPCADDPRFVAFCVMIDAEGSVQCACGSTPATYTCDVYLSESPATVSCDEATFGVCDREISGIPCCRRYARCDAGMVVEDVSCTDDCAQSCDLVATQADCDALSWCGWTGTACRARR